MGLERVVDEETARMEKKLGDLVKGVKGVRKICGSTDPKLNRFRISYRISFGYQRRHPYKVYLLIYDTEADKVSLCADGAIGSPPENVRQRLFERLGWKENGQWMRHGDYEESSSGWIMEWNQVRSYFYDKE